MTGNRSGQIERTSQAVGPEYKIKKLPKFSKSPKKVARAVLTWKPKFFKIGQTLEILLWEICHQELTKIAKSGHTGS